LNVQKQRRIFITPSAKSQLTARDGVLEPYTRFRARQVAVEIEPLQRLDGHQMV
jgi:hypothetical protein